jgi:cytochrome b subunit of formate dehydrogenase
MATIIVVSGFAIYKPTQLYPLPLLFGGYEGARLVHFWTTIGLSLFFVVHVLQVLRAGWANFRSMVTGYVIERPSNSVAPLPHDIPHAGTADTVNVGDRAEEVAG